MEVDREGSNKQRLAHRANTQAHIKFCKYKWNEIDEIKPHRQRQYSARWLKFVRIALVRCALSSDSQRAATEKMKSKLNEMNNNKINVNILARRQRGAERETERGRQELRNKKTTDTTHTAIEAVSGARASTYEIESSDYTQIYTIFSKVC